jgi:hypothetical protein
MSDNYRKESMPPKTIAANILNSYGGGEPYIEGVQYTAFGRKKEVDKFNQTLKLTANSSGSMELYVGDYGVGKSFVLALFQSLAIKKDFVVMTTTIDTRSRYFAGSTYDKQGLALYRSLIENTSVKGAPKGGAFNAILEDWYFDLNEKTNNGGLSAIFAEFNRQTSAYNTLPMYSDIREAIFTRFKEINDNAVDSKAMDFFLANFTTKSDAKVVGAKDYIKETTWFNVLNTYSHLFVAAGKKGLIVLIDQIDFLTSLNKQAREQNYDFILAMWNQINQGRTQYFSMCLFGASNILYDRNGFQINQPLYERTLDSYVIETLPSGEMVALLMKLLQIHEYFHNWESGLSEKDIQDFIDQIMGGAPMSGNCVRPISKGWVKHLNTLVREGSSNLLSYVPEIKEEMSITEEDVPIVFQDD